jgi:hypothetical protein
MQKSKRALEETGEPDVSVGRDEMANGEHPNVPFSTPPLPGDPIYDMRSDDRLTTRRSPVIDQESPTPKQAVSPEESDPLKAEISFFNNCREQRPSGISSVLQFIHEVRLGTYREQIEQIRGHMERGQEQQANELKNLLPAVSLSGMVTEGTRKNAHGEGRFKHGGYLQGDFDAKDFHPRSADEIKAMLSRDEHVQAAFLSARGGVKTIIRIPVCETPAEHKRAFVAAESHFREKYGLKLDSSTKDPVRLCYVSYDPESHVNFSPATVLPVTAVKESGSGIEVRGAATTSTLDRANFVTATTAHLPLPLSADEIAAMLACIPPRPDYDHWLKISSAVWAATGDEATGTALLKDWSPEESTGEYSEKFKTRLLDITAGTLVRLARKNGYRIPSEENDDSIVAIPDNVFPVPAGDVEYNEAGEKIFGVIATSHRLFMRGGVVVEVKDDQNEPAHFVEVSPERFCSQVEQFDHRVARREWQGAKNGNDKGQHIWRSTRLPVSAAKILLCSEAASRNLPPIRQLAACPILTKDLEVIGRGYHEHAGGTFVTDGTIPQEIPVQAAVTAMLSLLDDFNFVTPADKSRAVASILSPALKMGDWVTDDFPMDVAEAEQSQSGKTYRQKLVSRTYNELPSSITSPRGGVGSLDENISAALIKGRPFITLDNIRGSLDSTILEQAIRGVRRVACRALRTSADVDTKPFIWQLSTNGADFTRDIANRSIITRIRKQSADYHFNEYNEGDLLAHVAAQQPFYLGAVFSIIREWARRGCPKTSENRHDFRGWCQSLDWIVQNIFELAPLLDGHREEQARTANPALQWLRDVTMAVRAQGQLGVELIASQLVGIAEDAGIIFPGNPLSREEPHQRAGKILSRVFRETDGQPVVVDGLTVTREERSVHVEGRGFEAQKLYSVEEVAEGGASRTPRRPGVE